MNIKKISKSLVLSIGLVGCALFPGLALSVTADDVVCRSCVNTSDIKHRSITTKKIKDGVVTTSKIKNGAVTAAKIADGPGSGVDADTVDGLHASELGGSSNLTTIVRMNYSSYDSSNNFGSEVITASCFSGEVLTGGGCDCWGNYTWNASTTNYGQMNSCAPAGNSMIGSCFTSVSDASLLKFGPPVTVYAVCAPSTLPSSAQASALTASVLSESSLQSDNKSGTPDAAAQSMIDSINSANDYLEEQMMLMKTQ